MCACYCEAEVCSSSVIVVYVVRLRIVFAKAALQKKVFHGTHGTPSGSTTGLVHGISSLSVFLLCCLRKSKIFIGGTIHTGVKHQFTCICTKESCEHLSHFKVTIHVVGVLQIWVNLMLTVLRIMINPCQHHLESFKLPESEL